MINRLRALSTFIKLKVNISPFTTHPCVGCLQPTRDDGLCNRCSAELPRNDTACARCALPLTPSISGLSGTLCGPCISQPPVFDRVVAPWLYSFPVNSLVSQFKYGRQRAFGRPLAGLLVTEISIRCADRPNCLVPVPMHPSRERERGFNQAEEIALWLADGLGVPVASHLVQRQKLGDTQSGLTRRQRLVNLKGAFRISGPIPEHVAIVDDVVTTGATAEELAKKLKKAGARKVEIWALARTPRIPADTL